jgi:hypothetical protein
MHGKRGKANNVEQSKAAWQCEQFCIASLKRFALIQILLFAENA